MSGRFISFIEKNQLALSIVFSSGTYIAQNHFELKKQKVEKARLKLHDKIHNLYAPIVGNRLLHNSAVEAIEEVHGKSVENVVADICLRKKGSDLEDWRCFYQRHLDALDKKFLELVEKNSHLVRNSDDLKLIQSMVSAIAKHQYQKEKWFSISSWTGEEKMDSVAKLSSEDWHLDANCGNFHEHREFFAKIYEIKKELLAERNKLDSQLRNDHEMNSITGLFSTMKSFVK